jgi:hypothetical protein
LVCRHPDALQEEREEPPHHAQDDAAETPTWRKALNVLEETIEQGADNPFLTTRAFAVWKAAYLKQLRLANDNSAAIRAAFEQCDSIAVE